MTAPHSADLDHAIRDNNLDLVDRILARQSDPAALLNEVTCHGRPRLVAAQTVEMAEKLLDHGADLAPVGRFWASGLFVNPQVDPAVGRFLVERGATLSPHAAAGLGLVADLRLMLDADPAAVNDPGGDGCTPLHFARSVETAALLIERGADVNSRDEDHDSTPAQWLIGSTPEVAEFLIEHGATPDLFVVAALGSRPLVERVLAAEPNSPAHRIGKSPFHPIGHLGRGGTILQWTLGFNCYAHQVAAAKGHTELLEFLRSQSDLPTQFLVACVMADRPAAEAIRAAHPAVISTLPDADKELLARYCWETNADIDAVRLMLDVGFPIDFPERSHGYTPLHNAAWGGFADLVDLLLERGHRTDLRDPTYHGTALDWAIHCCIHDGRHPEGQYGRVAAALVAAGCPWDRSRYPTGHSEIDDALCQGNG
jgi:hypothetical protein